MGVFDKFADAPNQIKKEGQEITIRFQRTGPTTGRISWNIPAPVAGCAKGAAQAYDGIVITINSKPSNYLSNAPKNGTFYNGDATGDADMHAGDKLDGAMIVGAFYHDKTTTYLDVNDIFPRTAYFVSGHAVDAQGRYHREGVHAYSLPTGSDDWGPDKAAKHDIVIDVVGGVNGSTSTGLQIDVPYTLKLVVDKKEYSVTVDGENVSNYTDLVSELKEKLALLGDVFVSPLSPRTNDLYYNAVTKELKRWDGEKQVLLSSLSHPDDPTMQSIDALWFTTSTSLLKRFNGSTWVVVPQYISTPNSPAALSCDQAWFDGTSVWLYKMTHWEKLHTYNQTRNPLLAPLLTCDDYWYNKTDGSVSVWDPDLRKWTSVNAIYFGTDPSLLNTGAFWYDETAKKVKQYVASNWGVVNDVTYLAALPATPAEYTEAAAGKTFIFDLKTEKLFQLIGLNWVQQDIVAYHVDPRDRTKSILWWNSTTDKLLAWNAIGAGAWVEVTSFTQSATNPALPQKLIENSAWYNPETKEVKLVFKTACKTIFPIIFNGTPGALPLGTVWYDSDDKKWYVWDGTVFNQVFPMYFEPTADFANPYFVAVGYYWLDEDTQVLKRWSGTAWQVVTFSDKPIVIPVGKFWFNSVNDQLYMWDGKTWIESTGLASVELIPPATSRHRSVLSFFTRGVGCASKIEIISEAGSILSMLTQPVIYTDPVSGEDGLMGGALYNQLGVGDDGSPDERRAVHDFVRNSFGIVQTEITKDHIDQCIDLALMELRKFSSYSYKRGVFFLDLKPNQQTYLLTNKCVGFNKVVGINSIHRARGGYGRITGSDNDIFEAAAIQRLYTMGTFDMLSFHLVSAYMEEMDTLFANRIMFNWNELERELGLHTRIIRKERVLVDGFFERTEQDLMVDRQTALWLRRWALAEAKKILSQTRGKFQTLPGPNGSTTLNASDLQTQAEDEMMKLREQLDDNSMQNLTAIGMRAHFIMG